LPIKFKDMESEFEKYIERNKEQFEKGAPSPKVWQQLQDQLIMHHQKKASIVKMRRVGLGVAAGLLFFISIGILLFKNAQQPIKSMKAGLAASPKHPAAGTASGRVNTDSLKLKKGLQVSAQAAHSQKESAYELTNDEYPQSLNYYTRQVANKQKQLWPLRGTDPDLYKESQNAIDGLNSMYDQLKKQLPGSINQQKVLKLMIKNLQMQEEILTNQLQLIREMQSPNQSNHEKSDKGI